jgi:hypothetical protein
LTYIPAEASVSRDTAGAMIGAHIPDAFADTGRLLLPKFLR